MKKSRLILPILFTVSLTGCFNSANESTDISTSIENVSNSELTSISNEENSTNEIDSSFEESSSEEIVSEIDDGQKNLVAYLEFDEIERGVFKDLTNNGHDAFITGSPQVVDIGNNSKAVRFATPGDHLEIENSDDFLFTEFDDFSVEIRFKWSGQLYDSWPCIFNKGLMISTNSYHYYGLWIDDSSGYLTLGTSNETANGILNTSASKPIDTNWHIAKIIQKSDENKLYFIVDDRLQAISFELNANDFLPFFIGYNGSGPNSGQFLGDIDYFKVYSKALSMENVDLHIRSVDTMERKNYIYTDNNRSMNLQYRIYYPSDYDENSASKYPLLFFLHGHGECGNDNNQQIRVLGGPNELLNNIVERDDTIIIAPQIICNPTNEWVNVNHNWLVGSRDTLGDPTLAMSAAMGLLDSYLESDKVDKNRVYAAGISMGGYGTWELITRRPELFAAAIPVCGAGYPTLADRLLDIGIWAFHGLNDNVVPYTGTKDMEDAIKNAGGTKMKATYFAGVDHSSWIPAYKTEGLIDWLYSQSKESDS